jgi:predicted nucleotidyltransferase
MVTRIAIPREQIADFCARHHIQRLALFGSVLRKDFGPESDIDVVVEFEPGHTPDFFRFVDMQDELSALLGRAVDLNTPAFLSRYFRQQVLDTAQVLYERAG